MTSWRKTPLATGCLAGIVVLIMSVTGVLLAYQQKITNWMDRDLRCAIGDHGTRRSQCTG